jgi:hypothetical protein
MMTNNELQIGQNPPEPINASFKNKNNAKISTTPQTMTSCQSFILSWFELSIQNLLDNIENNFVANTFYLSITVHKLRPLKYNSI